MKSLKQSLRLIFGLMVLTGVVASLSLYMQAEYGVRDSVKLGSGFVVGENYRETESGLGLSSSDHKRSDTVSAVAQVKSDGFRSESRALGFIEETYQKLFPGINGDQSYSGSGIQGDKDDDGNPPPCDDDNGTIDDNDNDDCDDDQGGGGGGQGDSQNDFDSCPPFFRPDRGLTRVLTVDKGLGETDEHDELTIHRIMLPEYGLESLYLEKAEPFYSNCGVDVTYMPRHCLIDKCRRLTGNFVLNAVAGNGDTEVVNWVAAASWSSSHGPGKGFGDWFHYGLGEEVNVWVANECGCVDKTFWKWEHVKGDYAYHLALAPMAKKVGSCRFEPSFDPDAPPNGCRDGQAAKQNPSVVVEVSEYKLHDERGFLLAGVGAPLFFTDQDEDGENDMPEADNYRFSIEIDTNRTGSEYGEFLFDSITFVGNEDFAHYVELRDGQGRVLQSGDEIAAGGMNDFSLRAIRGFEDAIPHGILVSYFPNGYDSEKDSDRYRHDAVRLHLNFQTFEPNAGLMLVENEVRSIPADVNEEQLPSTDLALRFTARSSLYPNKAFDDEVFAGSVVNWVSEDPESQFSPLQTEIGDLGVAYSQLTMPTEATRCYPYKIQIDELVYNDPSRNLQIPYLLSTPIEWQGGQVEVVPGKGASFEVELSEQSLRADHYATVDVKISEYKDRFGNTVSDGEEIRLGGLFSPGQRVDMEGVRLSELDDEAWTETTFALTEQGQFERTYRVSANPGSQDFRIESPLSEQEISLPLSEVSGSIECDKPSLDIALAEQALFSVEFIGADGQPVADGTPVYPLASTGQILDEYGEPFDLMKGLPTEDGKARFILDSRHATVQDDPQALVAAHCAHHGAVTMRVPIIKSEGLSFKFRNPSRMLAGDRTEDYIYYWERYEEPPLEFPIYAQAEVEVRGPDGGLVEVSQIIGDVLMCYHYESLGASQEVEDACGEFPATGYGVEVDAEDYAEGLASFYFDGTSVVETIHRPELDLPEFSGSLWIKPENEGGDLLARAGVFRLSLTNSHQVSLEVETNQGNYQLLHSQAVTLNQWTKIEFVVSDSVLVLEVGNQREDLLISGDLNLASSSLMVGESYRGHIDEVQMVEYIQSGALSKWVEIDGLDASGQIRLGPDASLITLKSTGAMLYESDEAEKFKSIVLKGELIDESFGPGDDDDDPGTLEIIVDESLMFAGDTIGSFMTTVYSILPYTETQGYEDIEAISKKFVDIGRGPVGQTGFSFTSASDAVETGHYVASLFPGGATPQHLDGILATASLAARACPPMKLAVEALKGFARTFAKLSGKARRIFSEYFGRWCVDLYDVFKVKGLSDATIFAKEGIPLFRALSKMPEDELKWMVSYIHDPSDWHYFSQMCRNVGEEKFLETISKLARGAGRTKDGSQALAMRTLAQMHPSTVTRIDQQGEYYNFVTHLNIAASRVGGRLDGLMRQARETTKVDFPKFMKDLSAISGKEGHDFEQLFTLNEHAWKHHGDQIATAIKEMARMTKGKPDVKCTFVANERFYSFKSDEIYAKVVWDVQNFEEGYGAGTRNVTTLHEHVVLSGLVFGTGQGRPVFLLFKNQAELDKFADIVRTTPDRMLDQAGKKLLIDSLWVSR